MSHASRPLRPVFLPALLFAAAPSLRAQVAGTVVDAGTGAPLAGALVTLQATDVRTVAAPDGTFLLPGVAGPAQKIVAAKKGFYNAPLVLDAPASGVVLPLEAVVVGNDPAYPLLSPSTCGLCHPDQEARWAGSPMSKAGTNAWVYDVYDGTGSPGGLGGFVYLRDSVHAATNPASECASCHQPEPWIAQPYSPLEPIENPSAGALHGVSCEVCHKIADVDETKTNFPGIWPGAVTHNRPAPPVFLHQVEYGLLGDASFAAAGVMRPSYQPQLSGAACAACHQDKNDPDDDGNFEEPNGVVSEPTWEEWLASPFGDPASPFRATCVDCHMPLSGASEACVFDPLPRIPSPLRSHRIEGTTPEFLENAVELTLSVQEAPNDLQASVTIANTSTGHHVPTGVTVRNVILLVEAWRVADGQKLVHLGPQVVHPLGGVGDPAQGYFAGLPGKLYAKVNHDAALNGPVFYTDATGILWDNRIPAFGSDTTNYVFALPPGGGAIRVRARLIYRRAFRALVDAKGWATTGHGDPLADLEAPAFGSLMEEATWTSGGTGSVAPFGSGCSGLAAGSRGDATIGASDLVLALSGALPAAPAALFLGASATAWGPTPLPLDLGPYGAPGCSLLVSPGFVFPQATDAFGGARMGLSAPFLPALVGATFYAQWFAADPSLALGWAASNALAATLQP